MGALGQTVIDRSVLDAARRGDAAAQAELYDRTASAAYTVIVRLVRRPAVAEELLQDTYVEAFRRLDQYQGEAPFGAWLRAIAVSRCLMYLRSPWHRSLEWFDQPDTDDGGAMGADRFASAAADPGELAGAQRDLERALMRLQPLARAVVWLHDVEGCTHEEIATQLGRTVSFSKSQLSRAHERLRDLLGSQGVVPCTSLTTNS